MLRYVSRLVILLGWIAATPALAQSPDESGNAATTASAVAYLDTYGDLDVDALSRIYAEDARFVDETSLILPDPFNWEGRDAILAGIRGWREASLRHIDYELSSIFEAADRVVFVGDVLTERDGPDGPVRYRYPAVTIVTLSDGMVVEHRDYIDYRGGLRID